LVETESDAAVSLTATTPPPVVPQPPSPRRTVVEPLAPERYRLEFTVGKETRDKLQLVRDLLAREIPDGDLGIIFDRSLTLVLKEAQRTKLAVTATPRAPRPTKPRSRHVPAHIQRAVNRRDGGRCAFVSRDGRRCEAKRYLEYHHVRPYAADGEMSVENISLRCRAHNVYESELVFGRFDSSLVREAQAGYVAFGSGDRFQNL
jgi:5-methylcytosine-specific restriction endonuclease McrA